MQLRISTPENRAWVEATTLSKERQSSVASKSRIEVIHDVDPYVQVTQTDAGTVIPRHSHSTSEVMVVLDGSLEVAGTMCGTGTVLVLPANLEYEVAIGAEGATFAVIRERHGRIAKAQGSS